MNMLTKLYTEIRRYGEILDYLDWENEKGYFRRIAIIYEGFVYSFTLCNGEVIEVAIIET